MKIEELNYTRNLKLETIDDFKKIIEEAVESNYCHKKKFGSWLYEEYSDISKGDNKEYRALLIIMNDCYNNKLKRFHVGNKDIDSVTIYSVFYTDKCVGGSFVTHKINLFYEAIKSFKLLNTKIMEG